MITNTYFINVETAQNIKPDSNLALISISPIDTPRILQFEKGWENRLLYLHFYDIDRYVEDLFGLFDSSHAKKSLNL